MAKPKDGDMVKVHYTGKLGDGTVFDTSEGRDPLEFQLGKGQIIPGFEKAVRDLEPDGSVTVTLGVEDAYGPPNAELVFDVDRSKLPADLEPKTGEKLHMSGPDGRGVPVVIKAVEGDKVTIDANHPLAGKDLTFEIKLLAVG